MSQQRLLLVVGVAYLVAFFLPWQSGGGFASSGYAELLASEWSRARLLLLAIPVFGVALVIASLKAVRVAVIVAIVAGLAILGHFAWSILGPRNEASLAPADIFAMAGPGFWLLIVAAIVGLASPLVSRRN